MSLLVETLKRSKIIIFFIGKFKLRTVSFFDAVGFFDCASSISFILATSSAITDYLILKRLLFFLSRFAIDPGILGFLNKQVEKTIQKERNEKLSKLD